MNDYYLNRIIRHANEKLKTSHEALRYLRDRGVSKEQLDTLQLGYIPPEEWPPYVDPEEATEDEALYLKRSGKGYKLRGKLLFPMTNAMGMVRGFQIRTPSREVKDYWKFYSSRSGIDGLFFGTASAMPYIWDTKEVVLVEGIFDLFPVRRVFPNSICTGTAKVSQEQMTFLSRYVNVVKVMFDNDEYGERFFDSFYRDFQDKFHAIERLRYAGKDPSDSWQRLGEVGFKSQFNSELRPLVNGCKTAPLFGA